MNDIVIIPKSLWENAPEVLAEESRNIPLPTQNWGASHCPPSPSFSRLPNTQCEQPLF